MNTGGRPPAVRRFLHRPRAWLALTVVALPVFYALDEAGRVTAEPSDDVVVVEGRAGEASYGGIDVTYRNPLTDQRVETFVGLGGDVPEPEPGEAVQLVVDRDDPEDARLVGDRPPQTWDLVTISLVFGVALAWALLRGQAVRAAERLAGGGGPAFALLGTLEPPRRLGRRPCLHLWPLDAPAGSSALCAVPVLSTGGMPVGGPCFPVEVKGSPRNLGRVVAHVPGAVLWPSSRCLLSPWAERPERTLTADEVGAAATLPRADEEAAGAVPAEVQPPQGFLAVHVFLGVALAASLAALAIVAGITATHAAEADDLERDGVDVIAEIRERNETTVSVTYRLPGEDQVRQGIVPVDYPGDQKIGLRLPAYVNPDRPARLRFARESYDAVEPVAWVATPAVFVLVELVRRGRIWRRWRRVAERGHWHPVSATRRVNDHSQFIVVGPDSPCRWDAAEVRVAGGDCETIGPWREDGTVRLEAAGDLDPGGVVALRCDGRLLAVTSTSRLPHAAGRRPRGFGRLLRRA